MSKVTSIYVCQQCGFQSSSYLGKCPQCESWNSMVETIEKATGNRQQAVSEKAEIVDLSKIEQVKYQRLGTRLEEFDRVLGGGIVPGSLVLVSGDPGIGKSTLLTQLALNVQATGNRQQAVDKKQEVTSAYSLTPKACLYVAGEESAQQIKIRVDRISTNAKLRVLNEVDVDVIIGAIKQEKPGLVIVDSIQTLETEDLSSVAGSIGQVRECAHRLQRMAKSLHIAVFLVGHVNKEGNIAGPKTLEHMVDVVLSLEGEQNSQFRVLRSIKNRFGSTDEVGIFEMAESGMIEVSSPSKIFLDTKIEAPGSAIVPILTGLRPILVEIQALVTKTNSPISRRIGQGVDNNRLQLLVAVLQKRMGIPLWDQDVFVNATGGLKINEPAADLAICMAIISSYKDKIIKKGTTFVGEVGLLGEIRGVRGEKQRINEARKLGFSQVIYSENAKNLPQALKLALE